MSICHLPVEAAGILLEAFSSRISIEEAVTRRVAMSPVSPEAASIASELELEDARLLAWFREQFPVRFDLGEIHEVELHLVAHSAGMTFVEAESRLRHMRFTVISSADPLPEIRRFERRLMSRTRSGYPPWRAHGEVLPAADVLLLAFRTKKPLHVVEKRARRLGLGIPDLEAAFTELSRRSPASPR